MTVKISEINKLKKHWFWCKDEAYNAKDRNYLTRSKRSNTFCRSDQFTNFLELKQRKIAKPLKNKLKFKTSNDWSNPKSKFRSRKHVSDKNWYREQYLIFILVYITYNGYFVQRWRVLWNNNCYNQWIIKWLIFLKIYRLKWLIKTKIWTFLYVCKLLHVVTLSRGGF